METDAIARLTEREKDCLRRWLDHRTAKEIALDLRISPHAVEKRLKMARTKLGVSSSLEAARLLEASEGYQPAGPYVPDLAAGEPSRNHGITLATVIGVTVMTLLAAAAIIAASQAGSASTARADTPVAPQARVQPSALPPGNVAPSAAEIVHITQTTFHNVDADHSGYIDGAESAIKAPQGPQPVYRRNADGKVEPTSEMAEQDDNVIRAEFYERVDKDGDGRVSYAEFHHWMAPNVARNGIPVAWRDNIRRWMSPEG